MKITTQKILIKLGWIRVKQVMNVQLWQNSLVRHFLIETRLTANWNYIWLERWSWNHRNVHTPQTCKTLECLPGVWPLFDCRIPNYSSNPRHRQDVEHTQLMLRLRLQFKRCNAFSYIHSIPAVALLMHTWMHLNFTIQEARCLHKV